jgi:hypothetical protein
MVFCVRTFSLRRLGRLFFYLDRLGYESELGYSDRDDTEIDARMDTIECEILREDDRPRECSIETLLHEETLRIQIDR